MQTTSISQFWIPVSVRVFVRVLTTGCIFGQFPFHGPALLAIHDKRLCAGRASSVASASPSAQVQIMPYAMAFFSFSKHNILISERFARIFSISYAKICAVFLDCDPAQCWQVSACRGRSLTRWQLSLPGSGRVPDRKVPQGCNSQGSESAGCTS